MQLAKYDPFADARKLDGYFDGLWRNGWGLVPSSNETPALDMYEEDGKLMARIHLPNFNKQDIKVMADNGVLEISAEHSESDQDKTKRHYYVRESSTTYARSVTLPNNIDSSRVEAHFKHGTLTVAMPIIEQTESKLVDIT